MAHVKVVFPDIGSSGERMKYVSDDKAEREFLAGKLVNMFVNVVDAETNETFSLRQPLRLNGRQVTKGRRIFFEKVCEMKRAIRKSGYVVLGRRFWIED